MKTKIIAVTLLAALALALFAGCGNTETATTDAKTVKYGDVDMTALEIDLDALVAEMKSKLKFDDVDLFALEDSIVGTLYKIGTGAVDVSAVASTGATAECITVVKAATADEAKNIAKAFADYCTMMSGVYASYNAVESAKLTKAYITSNGVYAFLCVSPDSAKAQTVFEDYVVSLVK